MIRLMAIIACRRKRAVSHVTWNRSFVHAVHGVAQLADSWTSGTFRFGIPVLAVDYRNTRSHQTPSHRMVIEPHCRPSVRLVIHRRSDA